MASATTKRRTVWGVPVKIEQLKAGLRAHIRTQDLRTAFVSATNNKLPPELVDTIMEPIFAHLHSLFLQKWSILYLCSIGTYDHRTVGTICRQAIELGFQDAVQSRWLYACGRSSVHSTYIHCAPCEAIVQYIQSFKHSNITCSDFGQYPDAEDYEDVAIDLNNPFDVHPAAGRVCGSGLQYSNHYDDQAVYSLAQNWSDALSNGLFFSPREMDTLAAFGVECMLRICNSCTSVLLIPHGSSQSQKQPIQTSDTHALACDRVLQGLHVDVCNKLIRTSVEEESAAQWPQLISINGNPYELTVVAGHRPGRWKIVKAKADES